MWYCFQQLTSNEAIKLWSHQLMSDNCYNRHSASNSKTSKKSSRLVEQSFRFAGLFYFFSSSSDVTVAVCFLFCISVNRYKNSATHSEFSPWVLYIISLTVLCSYFSPSKRLRLLHQDNFFLIWSSTLNGRWFPMDFYAHACLSRISN